MTEEDQRLELVYELTLQSAEVDSWSSHDQVCLRELNESGGMDANGRLSHIPRQAAETGAAEVSDRLGARRNQPW
jgi:hypothetical protein